MNFSISFTLCGKRLLFFLHAFRSALPLHHLILAIRPLTTNNKITTIFFFLSFFIYFSKWHAREFFYFFLLFCSSTSTTSSCENKIEKKHLFDLAVGRNECANIAWKRKIIIIKRRLRRWVEGNFGTQCVRCVPLLQKCQSLSLFLSAIKSASEKKLLCCDKKSKFHWLCCITKASVTLKLRTVRYHFYWKTSKAK